MACTYHEVTFVLNTLHTFPKNVPPYSNAAELTSYKEAMVLPQVRRRVKGLASFGPGQFTMSSLDNKQRKLPIFP